MMLWMSLPLHAIHCPDRLGCLRSTRQALHIGSKHLHSPFAKPKSSRNALITHDMLDIGCDGLGKPLCFQTRSL